MLLDFDWESVRLLLLAVEPCLSFLLLLLLIPSAPLVAPLAIAH